jgi:glycosyltransferase involved in cell wall biosynthesis
MPQTVLVFRSSLLPYSETFIHDQVMAYQQWQAVLVGRARTQNGLSLDALKAHHQVCVLQDEFSLPGILGALVHKASWAMADRLGKPSPWILAQCKRLVHATGASVIHAHFGVEGVEIAPYAQALGLPLVVTLHGYDINITPDYWHQGLGGKRYQNYPERLIALAQSPHVTFVCVSDAIRQTAIARGLPPDKLLVRYIGIDTQRFCPGSIPIAERSPTVFYVGRLIEKKGCEYLIRAFSQVLAQVPQAQLVIAGDGPLMPSLQAMAADLKVPAQFLGAVSSTVVKQHLDQAQVFCLPSITAQNGDAEGLNIVVMEAQAAGVPVVTSARGAVTEGMIHGQTGFAFAEHDHRALANSVVTLLHDPARCAQMGTAARALMVGKFDIRHCTQALEVVYDQVAIN